MHLTFIHFLFLGLAACIAGCIDTIAGGGGLICVPALLLAGLPPHYVLGTNKFQATIGSGTATYHFMRHGNTSFREIYLGCLFCLFGATLGTLCIEQLNPDFLAKLLPFLLIGVLIYIICTPKAGEIKRQAHMNRTPFFILFGMVLGFYDGFFGPGTGTFWTVAMIALLGWDIKQATMHAKTYNFVSNLVALTWFMLSGQVLYAVGLTMAIGQFLGARVGAWLLINKGTRLIKPLFITMVSMMLISLLYKHFA